MAERTLRGEGDRKQEDEEMTTGEPVRATAGGTGGGGTRAADTTNTTRDKSVLPADDNQRSADKKS